MYTFLIVKCYSSWMCARVSSKLPIINFIQRFINRSFHYINFKCFSICLCDIFLYEGKKPLPPTLFVPKLKSIPFNSVFFWNCNFYSTVLLNLLQGFHNFILIYPSFMFRLKTQALVQTFLKYLGITLHF